MTDILKDHPLQFLETGPIRTAYRSVGSGKPLVMMIGMGGTMSEWDRRLISQFSLSYQVIVYDNRGIGYSSGENDECSIQAMVTDVYLLLKGLGISKGHFFGYSLGSMIGLQLAATYPDMVCSLLLCCASLSGACVYSRITSFMDPQNPGMIPPCARFPLEFLNQHPRLSEVFPPSDHQINVPAIIRQLEAIRAWNISGETLARISKPVLLLNGEEDCITPVEDGKTLASHLKNATFIGIPGGGHGMMYQFPDQIAALTLGFLSQ